jgi:hypothetical protein
MTRTIAETKMADGITIRLLERDEYPRYLMNYSDHEIVGYPEPIADDLRIAKRKYETWINTYKGISR